MRPVGQDRLRPCSDATRRCSAVYANRIRLRSNIGKEAMRRRAEVVERSFAHTLERGGMRRTWLRGRENVRKRYLILDLHAPGLDQIDRKPGQEGVEHPGVTEEGHGRCKDERLAEIVAKGLRSLVCQAG